MGTQQIEPDRREIWRYLGYRSRIPDERVLSAAERCIDSLDGVITPGFVSMECPLRFAGGHVLEIEDMKIESVRLAAHLEGCTRVVLFAATLGIGPDRLMKRAAVSGSSDMVILQAAGAAMIEAYCSRKDDEIRSRARQAGLFARKRYSPGYGDFSLRHQQDILRMLQAPKKIGLTLTDSMMMVPSKSVTAVIGLSEAPAPTGERCEANSCDLCGKTDCSFRR